MTAAASLSAVALRITGTELALNSLHRLLQPARGEQVLRNRTGMDYLAFLDFVDFYL